MAGQPGGGEPLCQEHQEALKLFCDQDQVLICVICRESQAHRAHNVRPREEAAQEYKEQIEAQLDALKRQKEECLERKRAGQQQTRKYLGQIEDVKKTIKLEIRGLQHFLKKQERVLLAHVDRLDTDLQKIHSENINNFSEELLQLEDLISEMEEKCRQPANEFLQDIRSTLSRCEKEKCEEPVAVPQGLRDTLTVSSLRILCLQKVLKKCKEDLLFRVNFLISKAEEEGQATLDPDLENPCSLLSTAESVAYQG
ncbi:zinc finger protein RFP-like isoform X1 [Carettochelys insculpta]|uniref:zinc finger protein RFP-like isoform X1 n=1 Tax=Carettochelys insculpta TaxID=44489 RepID=UPI003EB93FBE